VSARTLEGTPQDVWQHSDGEFEEDGLDAQEKELLL
jgi:hypothetical protein